MAFGQFLGLSVEHDCSLSTWVRGRAKFPKRKEATSTDPAKWSDASPTAKIRMYAASSVRIWKLKLNTAPRSIFHRTASILGGISSFKDAQASTERTPRPTPGTAYDSGQNSLPRFPDPPRVIRIPRWRT